MLPINISPTDRPQWHTPAEIRAAAAESLRIDYNAGRGQVIRCRKAAVNRAIKAVAANPAAYLADNEEESNA